MPAHGSHRKITSFAALLVLLTVSLLAAMLGGTASVQTMLGTLYDRGLGVPQDYAEAAKWLRKAADQGNPYAQNNLGVMYVDGHGVPQDYVEAYVWFEVAMSRYPTRDNSMRKGAVFNRDKVARKMTAVQIAEAQKRARVESDEVTTTIQPRQQTTQELSVACIRLLIAPLAALYAGIALASDWQFFGFSKQGKDDTFLAFDAESISHPTKETTRVSTKAIAVSELEGYLKSHNKSVVDNTARKRLTGYVPPALSLPTVRASYADAKGLRRKILVTSYELIANTPDIHAVSKFYLEIDCASKRIKMLYGALFDDSGNPKYPSEQSNGEYQFIAPDSNGEWLSLLVCPTK